MRQSFYQFSTNGFLLFGEENHASQCRSGSVPSATPVQEISALDHVRGYDADCFFEAGLTRNRTI